MPEMRPRTKAPKGEQLDEELKGELSTYEKVGLFQSSVTERTAWRGENLTFPIRMSRHLPPYIEASVVASILKLARENPKDYLILRLMSDAGLRRQEVVDLKVKIAGTRGRFYGVTAPLLNTLK